MKVINWLDKHFEEYILVILSLLTVVVIFIQVVMRYLLDSSLVWSEELARYAFIWMVFIGVSYAVKKQRHITVDAFALLFNDKGKIVLAMIGNVFFFSFCLILAYFGYGVILKVSRLSPALEIPLGWIYAAPVVGLILSAIRLIQILYKQVKELKTL
ncbi:TRAP transporter small permease [Bacillus taeanensis]|uniref:TRAP transporter small permease n=1 Tax=Bacillus taeanensis TaxID=273032 RepID=A0A366XPU0_9BACI|nr:TRAP transporter small permease [Bacillus taeanensis]RBW68380.1 TRAP transporter small permease [Bacillus taeanensis]